MSFPFGMYCRIRPLANQERPIAVTRRDLAMLRCGPPKLPLVHRTAFKLLRMNVTLFGYSLIEAAKINNVDPQAWMPEVLDPIADHKTGESIERYCRMRSSI